MTERHFIISLTEDLTVSKTRGKLTRNSNGTQWLDVELDGWKLPEGAALYIELSHLDGDSGLTSIVGPINAILNPETGRYVTLAPPEIITVAGKWNYSIELRYDIIDTSGEDTRKSEICVADGEGVLYKTTVIKGLDKSTGLSTEITVKTDKDGDVISTSTVVGAVEEKVLTYNSLTSAVYQLEVIDTVISPGAGNSFTREAELLTAAETLTAAILAGHSAEEALAAAMNAQTVATEQANAAANSAAQASVSEQNAANSATGAESAKQAAQASATEAHGWADIAKQWADYGIKINTEYTSLEELPDPGDSRFIYLIPNGGTGENSYDEYIWAVSKSAYEKIGTTEIDLTAYATKNEVNAGMQGKLDKTDGVAENLSVKNNLMALTIDTEHINGRAGEPLIEQRPRMYAIAFGNMNNEMRLYGKAERPVYTANKVDADGELTTAEEEVAFVSDVDQKVNKSGDIMTGGLTVPALNVDSGNGDGLYIELGRRGNTGLEFHCQQNADVYCDFDATIQARDANSTASNGSGVLNYVAREHSFEGSIVAPGTHNFIERGNEFNFANGYSGNEIWLNYRNASIGQYVFGNGAGGAANVIAGEVYDNDARVYSPNNKQPIITQSYLGGNPTTQKNCHGYLVFDSGNNGTGEIMICFGMFTSTTAEISFAKPFYGTPFVMTSPNHSTDMQTQRVAVKTTTNTGFTTESSGSYSGRYIAIGYR